MRLFKKECKRIAKSLVYYLFLGLLLILWSQNISGGTSDEIHKATNQSTQIQRDSNTWERPILKKPNKKDSFYGIRKEEIPAKLMCGAADQLIIEYKENGYSTYPFGYYKCVRLSEANQKKVLSIIQEITGLSKKEIQNVPDGYFPAINGSIIHQNADNMKKNSDGTFVISNEASTKDEVSTNRQFQSQVTYERFKQLMQQMEKMLGRGSNYSIDSLITYFGHKEMNYAQAVQEYQTTMKTDKVTGAFARLFCDYMSIPLGLIPVFLVVLFWMQDRRYQMQELIASRDSRSINIVGTRFAAGVFMTIMPVYLLSLESLFPLIKYGCEYGINVNCFAFLSYITVWLLPIVMVIWALGSFITVLTDSPIALLIQFIWWFVANGTTKLVGGTTWYTLMIRHNSLRDVDKVMKTRTVIEVNRAMYAVISLLLLLATTWIYERKKRGQLNAGDWYCRLAKRITHRA